MLNRLQDVFSSLQKHDVRHIIIGGRDVDLEDVRFLETPDSE